MRNIIKTEDDYQAILAKMAKGNPGALMVLMNLIKINEKVDPVAAGGAFHSILILDNIGVYGSAIWVLYKGLCKENMIDFIIVLKAYHLGLVTESLLLNIAHEKELPETFHKAYLMETLNNFIRVTVPDFNTGA